MPYEPFNRKAANDPDHWRLRADEARAVADSFVNVQAREQLMRIAESYDRLAELAEKNIILPESST